MAWIRAVWLEKGVEEEGVVPSNWKKGNYICWPKFLNVEKAAREAKEPDESWSKFPLVKVKISAGNISIYSFHM